MSKWFEGLPFIQFAKNQTWRPDIKQAPYKAMFDVESKVGLSITINIPLTVISTIKTEEDLIEMLKTS